MPTATRCTSGRDSAARRWEIVERYRLRDLITDCFEKPLYAHERMLGPLGVTVRPDFVVDDHSHLVYTFGGCTVERYLTEDTTDNEMERVYAVITREAARRSRRMAGAATAAGMRKARGFRWCAQRRAALTTAGLPASGGAALGRI